MNFSEKKTYLPVMATLLIFCFIAGVYYLTSSRTPQQKAQCDNPQHEKVFIKGGSFIIGDSSGYPEERGRQKIIIDEQKWPR